MGTPPTGGAAGINAAVTQFQQAYAAYSEDASYMHSLLEDIVGRKNAQGQSISTDQAYMMLICGFGQMVQVTGDKAGVQSAAQAVGAACSSEVNQLISDFNVLQQPPTASNAAAQAAAAQDLSNGLGVLQTVLTQNNALPPDQQWIDPSTVSNITSAISAFSTMFGASSGELPSPTAILNTVQMWSTIANSTTPPGTGQISRSQATENLQTSLGNLTTVNSAFSSSTTLQGNLLQNEFSQVTTMANAMRDLLQSLLTFARTVAGNLAPK